MIFFFLHLSYGLYVLITFEDKLFKLPYRKLKHGSIILKARFFKRDIFMSVDWSSRYHYGMYLWIIFFLQCENIE